jgi:predicted nucleic acid-binding protein
MTAPVFADTNVLVYARDPRDSAKRARAIEWIQLLWSDRRGRISTQVLSEYYSVITRKLAVPVPANDAWDDVRFFMAWNPQPIDAGILNLAHDVELRHHLNWWDCLIIAAAQSQGCAMLLTEDMQDGAEYGGVIVRNPFKLGVAEESTAYPTAPKLPSRHRGRGRPRRVASRPATASS